MRAWRAYHDGPMTRDDLITLCTDESHHLVKVLRLGVGAGIRLFDGRGSESFGVVEAVTAAGVQVRVGVAVDDAVEPRTRLTLLQSICRADRLESVLQKGTEIGVSEFRLVQTASSETLRITPSKRKRWERIVLEACKQSGRRILPLLHGPEGLGDLPGRFDLSTGPAVVLQPSAGQCGLTEVEGISGGGEVRLLVGPESGFVEGEVDLLIREGWQSAGLGPRTLRTETAGLVGAAIILALRGDLEP